MTVNESRAGVDPSLQPALDALTDDAAVDWNDLESRAPDPAVRETVRRLRIIARVAHAHEFASTLRDGQPFVPNLATPCDWGPLRVIESLARGAYGEVYRAWDPRLEREVALKLIDHDAGTDPGNGTVIEEGRVLARVRHPNVVTVYGADRRDGRIGIWTEFVTGRTLGQCLQQDGLFAPHDAASIIVDVCRGLAAVHCAGLVHGDIKSTNVMRGDEGRIVLMDFGASRYRDELQPVRIAGTPAYMAPEVIEGGRPNVRSDLYSVGVLLYHLVTGRYPVERSTFVELRDAYRQRSDLPLVDLRRDFPSPLAAVVQRALSRDPAHRYSSADAMADAIAAALDPAAPKPAVDVTSGRARWGIAAAVVLAVGVAAALGVYRVRTPTAQASLTFAPRDYVLITKFENRTGESIFDGAVEYALQRALSESTVVSLVPDERIEDALALMKRPRDTVIDKTIGREVAVRDGHIKALLAGRVERFGTSYVITAQLIDPSDNAVVATLGESARGQNGVLDALQRQAIRVRGALGEKLPAIHGADPNVEQASTSSLEAFQLYNESYRLGRENKWPAALATARQVVTVDPDFASGWIWLAWAVRNTEGIDAGTPEDPQISRYREYVDRAMQLVNRVPAWERHWVTGSYYTLTAQFASSIPEYQALLKFRPDHYFASNNLLRALLRLHRSQDYPLYLSTRQQIALQRPNDPGALVDAAQAAVPADGTGAIFPTVHRSTHRACRE